MADSYLQSNSIKDQHFLVNAVVVNKLLEIANIKSSDEIVEIGPGKGAITIQIAAKAKKITGIELDISYKPFLSEIESKYKNVEIKYENALNAFIPQCNKIIASLPFSITEPFIEKLLKCDFEEVIIITGDNFAISVINGEKNKLSLLTNCFFNVEYIMDVFPDSFSPKPRTKSSIIKMKKKKREELINNFEMYTFREIFFNRNKKIKNSVVESIISYSLKKDQVVTKRQAKNLIQPYISFLDMYVENSNNNEIKKIFDILSNIKIV